MTALEIILLLIGIICIAGSYVFMNKLDGPEKSDAMVNTTLSDKQKEDIKIQIAKVFDDQMESLTSDISDKTEVALEKISNQKIKELSEYSDTVLAEISRNHSEVMFLYDMLIEKNKEVHNTIKDLNTAMTQQPTVEKVVVEKLVEVPVETEPVVAEEEAAKPVTKKRTRAAKPVDEGAAPVKKRTTRKKAEPAETESAVEPETNNSQDDLDLPDDMEFLSGANKNKAILDLHNAGKSNVAIAKELGLGTGEVKLVIDLFKGQK